MLYLPLLPEYITKKNTLSIQNTCTALPEKNDNRIRPIKNIAIHGVFDVVPYMIWGNSYDDTTTIIDRVIMIWR